MFMAPVPVVPSATLLVWMPTAKGGVQSRVATRRKVRTGPGHNALNVFFWEGCFYMSCIEEASRKAFLGGWVGVKTLLATLSLGVSPQIWSCCSYPTTKLSLSPQ